MATSRNILKNWFSRGKKPTGEQFAGLIDSFWHKDEIISPSSNIYIPRLDVMSLRSEEPDEELRFGLNAPRVRYLFVRHRHNVNDEFWQHNPRIVLMRRVKNTNPTPTTLWKLPQNKWVCPTPNSQQNSEEVRNGSMVHLHGRIAPEMLLRNKVGGSGQAKDDAMCSWYRPNFFAGPPVDVGRLLKPFVSYKTQGDGPFAARISFTQQQKKIDFGVGGVLFAEFGFCIRIENPLFIKNEESENPYKNWQNYHFQPRYVYGEVTKVTASLNRHSGLIVLNIH